MRSYTRQFSTKRNTQSGAALIISLVLLIIITILSVTAMRNTNFETKISVNHQLKELSFRAAENALAIVTGPELDSIGIDIPNVVDETTTNANLFEATVTGQPSLSTEVDIWYQRKIDPKAGEGNMLFSGHQLDIITHLYQVDAKGTVNESGTTTHNRMQVALIRQ
jgi:type IV pilus assembly protein PilX